MVGRFELPPVAGLAYVAFLDAAGGSGSDSMTLALAHHERDRAVLDVVREVRPPFAPAQVVRDFAATLRAYRVTTATADRYAGPWVPDAFARDRVHVTPADLTKSELYRAFLPLVMSGTCELLDHPRLLQQAATLERRTGRSGHETIDHGPGLHDDVTNAAAGALVLAARGSGDARDYGFTSSCTWDVDDLGTLRI